MHSRIFQIEKESIPKEDYITADCIPDWFTYSIADYVSDDCDREDDINWLIESDLEDIASVIGDKLIFTSNTRSYFKSNYDTFIRAAKELSEVTIDNFIEGHTVSTPLYRLKKSFDDGYGFYVYRDNNLWTLDEFMRTVKDGEIYYIGGTVDYHF